MSLTSETENSFLPLWKSVTAYRARFPEARFLLLDDIPSTQDLVLHHLAAGTPDGIVVTALHQTLGRGRMGHNWSAPKGSALLVSIGIRVPASALSSLPFAVGLAVRETILSLSSARPLLKWPNDVLCDDRKISGILCESRSIGQDVLNVALGIGLNVTVHTFPESAHGVSLDSYVSPPPTLGNVLTNLIEHVPKWIDASLTQSLSSILDEWRSAAYGIGSVITATQHDGSMISGTFRNVDNDGALLIDTARGTERLLAADVHLGLHTPSVPL